MRPGDREHLFYLFRYTAVISLFVVFLGLVLWFFYIYGPGLLHILSPFLFSLLLAYLLSPLIALLEKRRVSRTMAILLVYVVFGIVIYLFGVGILSSLLREFQELVEDLPRYAEQLRVFMDKIGDEYRRFNIPPGVREMIDDNLEGFQKNLADRLEGVYSLLINMLGSLLLLIIVPVLTFYFLRDEYNLKRAFMKMLPRRWRPLIARISGDIDEILGNYFRGMLMISLGVGFLTYIGLWWLGVDFALFFGLFNTITNFIPLVGPLIGAVPAVLIAFLESPALAMKTILVIFIIQQAESYLVAPQVFGRTLKFHPLMVILLLMIGGKLFGFMGLLLVLPVTAAMQIIIKRAREYGR